MRVKVLAYETLPSSRWANPRFKLHCEEGFYITSSDAADAYGLFYKWTSEHDENGRVAEIELTRARRIRHIKWVD